MKRTSIILVIVIVLFSFNAWAVEDKSTTGIFIGGSKELTPDLNLAYHAGWANLKVNQYPYLYLGLEHRFNDNFSLETLMGYGLEPLPEDEGIVYGLAPTFSFDQILLANQFEYWSGLNCLFSFHTQNIGLGSVRVGVDERVFYYLDEEDKLSRSWRIGPSVRLPFGKTTLGIHYFYSFEDDGQDSRIFKVNLVFNH